MHPRAFASARSLFPSFLLVGYIFLVWEGEKKERSAACSVQYEFPDIGELTSLCGFFAGQLTRLEKYFKNFFVPPLPSFSTNPDVVIYSRLINSPFFPEGATFSFSFSFSCSSFLHTQKYTSG